MPPLSLPLVEAPAFVYRNAAGVPDISKTTLRWLRVSVASLLAGTGCLTIGDPTPPVIYDWLHALEVEPATANSYLRGLRTLYSRLIRRGADLVNPAAAVPFLPQPAPRPRAVSSATYQAMLAVAGVRDAAILSILYATGCRLGGLLSMRLPWLEWINVDPPQLAAKVLEKRNQYRYVYAGGAEAARLRAYLETRPALDHDAVWITGRGRPLAMSTAHSIMRNLKLRAGIPTGTPANAHSFRHAFAIRMLDRGYDLPTVAAWLGHSDPAFTARVYAVRREDQLRAAYFNGRR